MALSFAKLIRPSFSRSLLQTQRCLATQAAVDLTPPNPKKAIFQPPSIGPMRTNIGIFGDMNVGKSTLMNLITNQATSIVDAKPGTTADVKAATMEFHKLGPVKLFDTAGINEEGQLGSKKKEKTYQALKESDVALVVINPASKLTKSGSLEPSSLKFELDVINTATKKERAVYIVFNVFSNQRAEFEAATGKKYETAIESIMAMLNDAYKQSLKKQKGHKGETVLDDHSTPTSLPFVTADLGAEKTNKSIVSFIESNYSPQLDHVSLIPQSYLTEDSIVVLNIPMDAETPSGRLLRPQSMVQEYCLRHFVSTYAYRMNLQHARSEDPALRAREQQRFSNVLSMLHSSSARAPSAAAEHGGLHAALVVTDSQAIDVVHPWTCHKHSLAPLVDVTTFSICMINYMSGGRLDSFVDGIKAFSQLKPGSKVLIAEACNHNRIPDTCDDIGTVQIPRKIANLFGKDNIQLEHAFGREFPDMKLNDYDLVVHCGGCMVDKQKIRARMEDCEEAGVPITNYGLLLSYCASPLSLNRVLKPWKLSVELPGHH